MHPRSEGSPRFRRPLSGEAGGKIVIAQGDVSDRTGVEARHTGDVTGPAPGIAAGVLEPMRATSPA